jgi:hypothetical protein
MVEEYMNEDVQRVMSKLMMKMQEAGEGITLEALSASPNKKPQHTPKASLDSESFSPNKAKTEKHGKPEKTR